MAQVYWGWDDGDLIADVVDPPFLAAEIDTSLGGDCSVVSARMRYYSTAGSNADTSAARQGGFRVTIDPGSPTTQWTLTSMVTYVRSSSGTRTLSFAREGVFPRIATKSVVQSTSAVSGWNVPVNQTFTGPQTFVFWSENTTSYIEFEDMAFEVVALAAPPQALSPSGIGPATAFGSPTVTQETDLAVAGIPSGVAFGVPSLAVHQVLTPQGIVSDETLGVPVVVVLQPVDLSLAGITSGEAFGAPSITIIASSWVPYPAGADVDEFLGAAGELVALAEVHVGVITHFARVYTRGNGFRVEGVHENIAAVILAATARLVSNPEQLDITVGSMRRASGFKGWSLAEQRVLNEYRGVAR